MILESIIDHFTKKLVFNMYFYWEDPKYIPINQNKHPKYLVLALIWKDPIPIISNSK